MDVTGLVEGVIFAAPQPVSAALLSELLSLTAEELEQVLEQLRNHYEQDSRGFSLVKVSGGYQFRTKPELREIMAKFHEKKPPRLTQATLEVLSVIAYKQPI